MANQYLAPSARQRGCQVKECKDAIEAGSFVRDKLKKDGIALFKGSSGGVWLEEAIKINLHTAVDENKLVLTINRQPIGEWFKEQWEKLRHGLRQSAEEPRKSRGFRM